MINKPTIIITSGGRTGTTFFSKLFSDVFKGCVALHEPGSIKWKTWKEVPWAIRKFGFLNITIKKILRQWGISSISNKRIYGLSTVKQAARQIERQRKKYIEDLDYIIYVESSYQYYGVIDILPEVFKNIKIIYLVRHGYDWVRSHINKNDWYTKRDIHSLFGMRLVPKYDDHFFQKWESFSQFQKVCWSWRKINSFAIASVERTPHAKLFRFEDIFHGDERYSHLKGLMDFCTSHFSNVFPYRSITGHLENQINRPSNYNFPNWTELPEIQKRQFKEICGPLMAKLGYFIEQ